MTAFNTAWGLLKAYEAPEFTNPGRRWLNEREHSLVEGEQPIRSFRNLTPAWKNRPKMSIQARLMRPSGRIQPPSQFTTLATSSTVPLDRFADFNINENQQLRAFESGERNKHATVEGMITRNILDQMLFDQANPQDLLDYDVEYNRHGEGMPVVLDAEGRPAPLASYWPYDYKNGQRTPNQYGGFVLTQMSDINQHPSQGVRMIIPNNARVVNELAVATPYGAAFPNKSIEELMREIGGRVV